MKGVRIEKGKIYWHVCIKREETKQGYVEVEKFISLDAAIEFARTKLLEAVK